MSQKDSNPVAHLPTELLILVFEFTILSHNWLLHHKARMILMLVSSRFQAIIHSTPSLWTFIVVHKKLSWTVTTVSLARSRDRLLDVVIHLYDGCQPHPRPSFDELRLCQEVYTHLHRWRSASFHLNCKDPELYFPTSPAPLLQTLRVGAHREGLSSEDRGGLASPRHTPWYSTLNGLRLLELNLKTGHELDLTDLMTILTASPTLCSLYLYSIRFVPILPSQPIHAVLPELRSIKMNLSHHYTGYLLQHIQAPPCRELQISCRVQEDTDTDIPTFMSALAPFIPRIRGPAAGLHVAENVMRYAFSPETFSIRLRHGPILTCLRHLLPILSRKMLSKSTTVSIDEHIPAPQGPRILRLIDASEMHVTRLEGVRENNVVDTLMDSDFLPALQRMVVDIRDVTPGLLSQMVNARASLQWLKVERAGPEHRADQEAIQNVGGCELVWEESQVGSNEPAVAEPQVAIQQIEGCGLVWKRSQFRSDGPSGSKWKRSVCAFFPRNHESSTQPVHKGDTIDLPSFMEPVIGFI